MHALRLQYDNTETGIQALGYGGLVYFVLFFYITNYQFLRIFVAIIAQNYELSEDEKLKVLTQAIPHPGSRGKRRHGQNSVLQRGDDECTRVADASENLGPDAVFGHQVSKENYDDFSFNTHYMNLLRGTPRHRCYPTQMPVTWTSSVVFWSDAESGAMLGAQLSLRELASYEQGDMSAMANGEEAEDDRPDAEKGKKK
eukprot:1125614-Rhodomonas_salina.1